MSTVLLPINFLSTIESLEDEFLGNQITPNCYVERIFYESFENELKEQSRIKEKPTYNYLDELSYEFEYTSINYEDFSLDNWNHVVHSFSNYFYQQELNVFFENIDRFLYNTNIDKITKEFTFNGIVNSIKLCISELQKVKNKKVLNEYQVTLVDVFVEIYKSLFKNLNTNKYGGFIQSTELSSQNKTRKIKKQHDNRIQDTEYYKLLFEIGFVEEIEYDNSQKIIATLGRSKSFGGFVFDVQKEYFAFCEKIGLIKFIEKDYCYDANKIGCFLAKISAFSSEHSSNNFKRYYQAINNPLNKRHFASNEKNVEKVENVLENLSKK